ncbi:rhodanese-like domain-containing protein [Psychrilyobacter atlanticus]|uniref:rhodanese-like domain-containing protein n=1 Tax=Psychrilyobacter atlanticus TaxID=271091 RepID=UPI00042059D3|nr:rhodanese-like domain-containing protein [Psychrilyobacter atlanticus]
MKKLLLVLGIMVVMAVQVMASNGIKIVDMNYVTERLNTENVVIIDVRSEEVYNGKTPGRGIKGGHISGAINVPLDTFMDIEDDSAKLELLRSKGVDMKTKIITYCNTGRKSQVLAEELVRLGYSDVNNYKGSMKEWGGVSTNIVVVK